MTSLLFEQATTFQFEVWQELPEPETQHNYLTACRTIDESMNIIKLVFDKYSMTDVIIVLHILNFNPLIKHVFYLGRRNLFTTSSF